MTTHEQEMVELLANAIAGKRNPSRADAEKYPELVNFGGDELEPVWRWDKAELNKLGAERVLEIYNSL